MIHFSGEAACYQSLFPRPGQTNSATLRWADQGPPAAAGANLRNMGMRENLRESAGKKIVPVICADSKPPIYADFNSPR